MGGGSSGSGGVVAGPKKKHQGRARYTFSPLDQGVQSGSKFSVLRIHVTSILFAKDACPCLPGKISTIQRGSCWELALATAMCRVACRRKIVCSSYASSSGRRVLPLRVLLCKYPPY